MIISLGGQAQSGGSRGLGRPPSQDKVAVQVPTSVQQYRSHVGSLRETQQVQACPFSGQPRPGTHTTWPKSVSQGRPLGRRATVRTNRPPGSAGDRSGPERRPESG